MVVSLVDVLEAVLQRLTPGVEAGDDGDREVDATIGAREVVRVDEYDPAIARYRCPWWDALDHKQKSVEAQNIDPVRSQTSDNTTTVGLQELCVDLLDGSRPVEQPITGLSIGTDGSATSVDDRALGNHVATIDITSFNDEDSTLKTRSFLGTGTANGKTIREVGLVADTFLLNHSLLATPIEKDSSTEANITAVLRFAAQ